MYRDERGIVEREKAGMPYPQPETDEIAGWVKDGPDTEDNRIYGDGLFPDITPPAARSRCYGSHPVHRGGFLFQ